MAMGMLLTVLGALQVIGPGAAPADPWMADLLGSINRIYGVPGRVEKARNYHGTYGFITD